MDALKKLTSTSNTSKDSPEGANNFVDLMSVQENQVDVKIVEDLTDEDLALSTSSLNLKEDLSNSSSTKPTTSTSTASNNNNNTTKSKSSFSQAFSKSSSALIGKGVNLVTSVAASISKKIFSADTEDALRETFEIVKLLVGDMGFRPIDISLCLGVLCVYHKTTVEKTGNVLTGKDVKDVEELLRFMKFATCSYGWKLLYGYVFKKSTQGVIDGVKLNDQANVQALVEHTGIKAEDVVQTRWTSSNVFAPGHYIALDHARKTIVIAIRGTFHLRDAITDLVCKYVPFRGGLAHSGMLNAATIKKLELLPIITELMKKYVGYEIVTVGHSLGAGTASLLSIMLKEEANIPLRCYAFACPCVVSLDIAERCKSFIITTVINDDVVPRLSFGSVNDLKLQMKDVLDQKDGKLARIFQIMAAGNQFGDKATNKIANYLKCNSRVHFEAKERSDRLFPPGRVLFIYGNKGGESPTTNQTNNSTSNNNQHNTSSLPVIPKSKYHTIEESHPTHFQDIVVSSTMYIDHFPNVYEDTIDWLYKKLLLESNQTNNNTPKLSKADLSNDI